MTHEPLDSRMKALPRFLAIQRSGLRLLAAGGEERQLCRKELLQLQHASLETSDWPCVISCARYLELDRRRHGATSDEVVLLSHPLVEALRLWQRSELDQAWAHLRLVQAREGIDPSLSRLLSQLEHQRLEVWRTAALKRGGHWQRPALEASDSGKLRECCVVLVDHGDNAPDQWQFALSTLAKEAEQIGVRLTVLASHFQAVVKDLFHPGLHDWDRIALVGDVHRIDLALLEAVELIVVWRGVSIAPDEKPRCSLITTLFRSELDLPAFLSNSASLHGYGIELEHVFAVASLSERETDLLIEHFQSHLGVMLLWQRRDPGLYVSWNQAIAVSRGDYLSNANVDDWRDPLHALRLVECLDRRLDVVVAATWLDWRDSVESLSVSSGMNHEGCFSLQQLASVSPAGGLRRMEPNNLPHCMPMWRRSLHDRYGWFREDRYGTFADWAFWLKVMSGAEKGWIEPIVLGAYLLRPDSHNRRSLDWLVWHRQIEDEFFDRWHASLSGC